MEEKKYPIYRFSATWNQSGFKNNGSYHFKCMRIS